MSQTFRTKAIVLRRTNYGEADRILQLLTPEHGKLSAMARGVRRSGSKMAGGLELLAETELTLIAGKGDLYTVTSARLETFFGHILEQYERLRQAYQCIADVARASEAVAEPESYDLLRTALASLNSPQIDLRLVDVWYRLQLAQLLGQGLNTVIDTAGQPLRGDAQYGFDEAVMAFMAVSGGPYGADEIKLLRVAGSNPPAILARIQLPDAVVERTVRVARALAKP